MKNTSKLLLSFVFLVLLGSCGKIQEKKEEVSEAAQKSVQKVKETAEDYASGEYKKIMDHFKTFKDSTNEQLSLLKKKTDNLDQDLRQKYNAQIDQIEAKKKKLQSKIEQYQEATGNKKEALRKEVRNLEDAINESIQTFKEELRNDTK